MIEAESVVTINHRDYVVESVESDGCGWMLHLVALDDVPPSEGDAHQP